MESFGGTYRERTPAETWQLVQPHLGHYGITRIADITDLDVIGIPVFAATRPSAVTVTCSQGKGATRELARVSAVMENLETAVAEAYRPLDAVHASLEEIGPEFGLESLSLARPSALTRATQLDWCPAEDVLDGTPRLLPLAVVSLSQETADSWCPALFARASNGLASGNTRTEAALHGLWEVVERECVLRFSRTALTDRRYVDPRSVDDPICAPLIDRMLTTGFHLEIVDASYGGWPAFAVYLYNSDMADVFGGAGAHADHAVALSRALTEAAQSRLAIISGLRDDIPAGTYRVRRVRTVFETVDSTQLLPWSESVRSAPAIDLTAGSAEHLARLARSVAAATGHRPLFVDLSPGHGDFHVCRVVAPGLRHDSGGKFARPATASDVQPEGLVQCG